MNTDVRPGQLWRSEQEENLGLGIVRDVGERHVGFWFPLADLERTYVMSSAPLSRVIFKEGDDLQLADGTRITVTALKEAGGTVTYICQRDNGQPFEIPESEVRRGPSQDDCLALWLRGRIEPARHFVLRARTLGAAHQHRASAGFGLSGPRVQLLPHQIYIAHEVATRPQPRVLLADEVGLGKSIEAGLILHRRLLGGETRSALVVVPEPLINQWLVELLRRLNLSVTVIGADTDALPDLTMDEAESIVLCPLNWLTASSSHLAMALDAEFDMMIVDEAHRLHWTEEEASSDYGAVEKLAHSIPAVILLTATPEQSGAVGHFARLRLLDPDRYTSVDAFEAEESSYIEIASLIEKIGETDHDEASLVAVEERLGTSARKALESASPAELPETVEAIQERLLDLYGTGRVMFRNTRAAVGGFPDRLVHPHQIASDQDEEAAMRQWLAQWLRDHANEKALLIVSSAEQAIALGAWLRERHGFHFPLFHEGMSLLERDRAAAYFTASDEGARLLICSEIGGEGRNFQRAHHLVLYDLPRAPDLLEQRIGRVDRIGQRATVHIHVPYIAESAQERWYRWYHEGLNAFESPNPLAGRIALALGDDLDRTLDESDDLTTLIAQTRELAAQLRTRLGDARNLMLERHSLRPHVAQATIKAIQELDASGPLQAFLDQVFDVFGVEHEIEANGQTIIRPGDHLLVDHFPALPDDGLTGTTDRALALEREDLAFLTWEHPMVLGAVELVLNRNMGRTALVTCSIPGLAPGTLIIEILYALHCPAPAALRVERFLNAPLIRFVTDGQGADLADRVSMNALHRAARAVAPAMIRPFIEQAGDIVRGTVETITSRASRERDAMVEQAQQRADESLGAELERINALARLNPAVSRDDVLAMQQLKIDTLDHLAQTQLHLDAIRVALVVEP